MFQVVYTLSRAYYAKQDVCYICSVKPRYNVSVDENENPEAHIVKV
jgi:hypothetical protein